MTLENEGEHRENEEVRFNNEGAGLIIEGMLLEIEEV